MANSYRSSFRVRLRENRSMKRRSRKRSRRSRKRKSRKRRRSRKHRRFRAGEDSKLAADVAEKAARGELAKLVCLACDKLGGAEAQEPVSSIAGSGVHDLTAPTVREARRRAASAPQAYTTPSRYDGLVEGEPLGGRGSAVSAAASRDYSRVGVSKRDLEGQRERQAARESAAHAAWKECESAEHAAWVSKWT